MDVFFFIGSGYTYLTVMRAGALARRCLEHEAPGAARKLGIFGAPTFAVGNEIFWGDDRLEEAIEWARRQ